MTGVQTCALPILGVSRGASEDEIKQAYLALVKKYHPDKYQGNPLADLAEEKLQEVNEAYDMLKEKSAYQSAYGPAGGGYANTYGGEPGYISIRQALDRGDLARAEQMLINIRNHDKVFERIEISNSAIVTTYMQAVPNTFPVFNKKSFIPLTVRKLPIANALIFNNCSSHNNTAPQSLSIL